MIDERLKVAITVATASASVEIPPGNVERVELTMTPYGFEANLAFWLKDGAAMGGSIADGLLTNFIADGLLKVTLAISSIYLRETMETPPDPLTVKGVVVSRPQDRRPDSDSALRDPCGGSGGGAVASAPPLRALCAEDRDGCGE